MPSNACIAGVCSAALLVMGCDVQLLTQPEMDEPSGEAQRSVSVTSTLPRNDSCRAVTHPIAFISTRSTIVESQLYVMAPDGGDGVRVTPGDFRGPAWSPDGRSIAVRTYSPVSGDMELAIISPEGTEYVTLLVEPGRPPNVTEPGVGHGPSWSADGERLAFASGGEGSSNVFVISRWGGDPEPVVPEVGVSRDWPRWSPIDSSRLAMVVRDEASDVWLVDVDSGALVQNLTGGRFSRPAAPRWSPDGSRLAFSAERVEGEAASREIYVLTLDGSEAPLQLTDDDAIDVEAAWSPDGGNLLVTSNLARLGADERDSAVADLWLVPLAAPHTARVLTSTDADSGSGAPLAGDASADWYAGDSCKER